MGKYFMLGGKKVYIQEDESTGTTGDTPPTEPTGEPKPVEGVKPTETPATPPVVEPATPPVEQSSSEDVERVAKMIGSLVREDLGIDKLKSQIKTVEDFVNQPENETLKRLLHGKDLVKDRDKLTKEEVIVGFFHALVTNNVVAVKALSEGVNADGGFLFPNEFLAELVKPLAEPGRMRALVRVIPMKRNVLNATSLLTKPKFYWTAENAAKTTTTATFGQPTLNAHKAAAIIYASDELIEDSTEHDVVKLIIDLFAEAIGELEDFSILAGNGTTQPTGIVTAVAAGTIASTTVATDLTFDDLIDLVHRVKSKYRKGASFLIHDNNVKELRKLKDSNGRYIWEEADMTKDTPSRLLGYAAHSVYDIPESEIYFGNWKLCYWLGDRQKMAVKISQDTTQAFTQDETAIRVVLRLAGNVVLGEAANAIIGLP